MTTTADLVKPDICVRVLSAEVESALHPKGMHVYTGKGSFSIDKVQRALALITQLERENAELREGGLCSACGNVAKFYKTSMT